MYISNHVIFYENSFPYVSGSNFSSVSQSCVSSNTVSSVLLSFTHFPIQSPLQPQSASDSSATSSPAPREVYAPSPSLSSSPISSPTDQSPNLSLPSHINSPPHVIPAAPPVGHHMITRSKAGIFKPKSCLADLLAKPSKLTSITQAISDPKWFKAMQEEYQALKTNDTWDLVFLSAPVKVIGSKWVFRIKHNSDGTISRYKARFVAKGFH